MSLPVTYPERYPYLYTGMGTETLAPKILLSNKSVFLSIAKFLYDLLTTISICSFSLNITSIMFKLQYRMLSIFI